MKLYFSIDLESWAYPDHPRFIGLDSFARKEIDSGFVLESINKILDLLARYNQKITFFTIAEIWDWYPEVFRWIKSAGHEIAYHTHRHTKILNADVMKQELKRSQGFLREFHPIGFRAPGIYLPPDAIQPLIESGFHYSSSLYGNYKDVLIVKEKNFYEFPISTFQYNLNKGRNLVYPRPMTFKMLREEIPFGSGYFFAFLPLVVIDKMIEKYFQADSPVFMFTHSWQIIIPRNASFPDIKYRLLHPSYILYTISVIKKVEYLLRTYTCGRMKELCESKRILE